MAIICTWQLKYNYYQTGTQVVVVPISTSKWKDLINSDE